MTPWAAFAVLALFVLPAHAQEAAPAVLTGVGFAPISSQPARTDEERRLLAIRATVSGTVSGARIVKITPKGDDTYETVVEMRRPAGGAD